MTNMTIKQVRDKFPQYGDLSDQQLADALHQKFYADMDQGDFYSKIGFAAPAAAPATPPAGPEGFAAEAQSLEFPTPPAPQKNPRVPPEMLLAPKAPTDLPQVDQPEVQAQPLVPPFQGTQTQPAPVMPAPAKDPLLAAVMGRDTTDDARAGRHLGKTAYLDGLVNAPKIPGANTFTAPQSPATAKPLVPQSPKPTQPDPFAGETLGDTAKRRGQQFMRGATEVPASIPEALSILGRDIVAERHPTFKQAIPALSKERDTLLGIIANNGSDSYEGIAASMRLKNVEGEIMRAAELVAQDEATLETPLTETPVFKMGDHIRKASEGVFGAPDPRDTTFWSKLAEGGGNMVGFVAASLLTGPAGTAGTGAALNSSQLYKEALQNGATDADARKAAMFGGFLGLTEVVPIQRALKVLPPKLRGEVSNRLAKRLIQIGQSAGEEAVQEAVQGIGNNLIAKGIYDPERGIMDDVGEQALIGAILGGGMSAIGQTVDAATGGKGDTDFADKTAFEPRHPKDEPEEDPILDSMGVKPEVVEQDQTPEPEQKNDILETMSPEPEPTPKATATDEQFEVIDEVETVDGETVPTGRKVRLNLKTGQVSPLDPEAKQDQGAAVQSRSQGEPSVGTDSVPVAGDATSETRDESEDAGSPEANLEADKAAGAILTQTLTSEEVGRVETDAKTFQYKDNGDQDGVTDRLQGVEAWDERSAMGGIVYEYADGRRVVADGHQRLGLAKRLQSNGVKTPWNVEIIREVDGYSPADVRNLAALKNIREGSGSAIDAAKVLRENASEIKSLNLPPKSALVRDAKGLARLSDEAFGMVVNEVVSPEWGAAVGENVENPALHSDIISLLKRLKPKNNAQAAMIAQQAGQVSTTETQGTLFGDEEVSESLYLERAKVLDAALKRLKRDKQTFKVLSDRANTITKEGNVLNAEANAQRVEDDSKAAAYLNAEANRKGPISDALSKAARDFKANPKQGHRIVGDFLAAVRGPEASQEPQGAGHDGGGTDPEAAPQSGSAGQEPDVKPDSAPPAGDVDLFGAPTGEKPKTEKTNSETDLFGGLPDQGDGKAEGQKAEADTIKKQSKARKLDGNTGDAGPLFDTQKDAFDGALDDMFGTEPSTRAGQYVDAGPKWAAESGFKDLSGDFDGFAPDNLGTQARDYVLENGRKKKIEFLVIFNADGEVISIGSGRKSGTGVSRGMSLIFDQDQSLVAHHNHPTSAPFSVADIVTLAAPGMEALYAHAHDGTVYRASATPALISAFGWKLATTDNGKNEFSHNVSAQAKMKRALHNLEMNLWKNGTYALSALKDKNIFPDAKSVKNGWSSEEVGRYHAAAWNMAMRDAGLITLDVQGDGERLFDPKKNPFLYDPALKKNYDVMVKGFKKMADDATKGKTDAVRSTANERHPGELDGIPVRSESGPTGKRKPSASDVRSGDKPRAKSGEDEGGSGGVTPKVKDALLHQVLMGLNFNKMKPDEARVLLERAGTKQPTDQRIDELVFKAGRINNTEQGLDLEFTNADSEGYRKLGIAPYTKEEILWVTTVLVERKKLRRKGQFLTPTDAFAAEVKAGIKPEDSLIDRAEEIGMALQKLGDDYGDNIIGMVERARDGNGSFLPQNIDTYAKRLKEKAKEKNLDADMMVKSIRDKAKRKRQEEEDRKKFPSKWALKDAGLLTDPLYEDPGQVGDKLYNGPSRLLQSPAVYATDKSGNERLFYKIDAFKDSDAVKHAEKVSGLKAEPKPDWVTGFSMGDDALYHHAVDLLSRGRSNALIARPELTNAESVAMAVGFAVTTKDHATKKQSLPDADAIEVMEAFGMPRPTDAEIESLLRTIKISKGDTNINIPQNKNRALRAWAEIYLNEKGFAKFKGNNRIPTSEFFDWLESSPKPDETKAAFDGALDDMFGDQDAAPGTVDVGPAPSKVNAITNSPETFKNWRNTVPSTGTTYGWTVFNDTEVGNGWVLMSKDQRVGDFRDESEAREWAKHNRATKLVDKTEKTKRTKADIAKDMKDILGGLKEDGPHAIKTQTAAFKRWFGDSKVVDENGDPLVVYHGSTEQGIEVFDTSRVTERGKGDQAGTYFTSDRLSASNYTRPRIGLPRVKGKRGSVTSAYLSVRKPFYTAEAIAKKQAQGLKFGDAKREVLKGLDRSVHDGIIFLGDGINPSEYVVFNPEQIKSVNNEGSFDPDNPNMLKEDGPKPVSDDKYTKLSPLFVEALDGIDPAANDLRGTFVAMIRPLAEAGLTRADVQALYPYFTRFLDDVKAGKIDLEGEGDAPSTSGDLEPDSGNAGSRDDVGGTDVPSAAGRDGQSTGAGGGTTDTGSGKREGSSGLPDGDAPTMGTGGDPSLSADARDQGKPADDRDGAGGSDRREQRPAADTGTAADTAQYATDKADLSDRAKVQAKADSVKVKVADRANIDASLPLLLPEQRDDVLKVEKRFAQTGKNGEAIGHGMLLTNGTGTGKTYSGGGVIKRFAQQGKDNILIMAPSQGILDAWVEMGADMGLDISKLDDTQTAGKGIVATTYANAGENNELAKRDWDLVVTDESQKLSQNQAGGPTAALNAVRAITNRPDDLWRRARMVHADEWAKWQAMPGRDSELLSFEQAQKAQEKKDDVRSRLDAKDKALVEKWKTQTRSKVLFLSATPFAYDKSVDYAAGYLFEYGADGTTESGSRQDGRNLFMVENFGYRIRYHKLTKPEAAVDTGVFEREFHERLKREGVLSGRSLDIDADYDRKFVKIKSADGEKIDEAIRLIHSKMGNTPEGRKWSALNDHVRKNFTYLRRLQLLEAIKATESINDIKAHIALGRKVVVFHDYNKGGGMNPFTGSDLVIPKAEAIEGYQLLAQEMPEVADLNFSDLKSPIETLSGAFGDQAKVYNGTVSQKDRKAAKDAFNKDGSGVDILIVQSAAGEAGISLHDTTGAHQRALINLGMPVRPTTTLQEEGRIRRVGSVSDAAFRYYTTGTAWEREAFAGKIASNSGTVENLALGDEARAIRDAFINAYMDADTYAPSPEDGKGGRDADRSTASTTPYDQAKTHYFARTKNSRSRNQRQGFDFYSTPEPLGFKMAGWAGARTYEKALEPSAGDGAIARYLPADADRTIIEPSLDLMTKAQLRTAGAKAIQSIFEDHHVVNKYDVVVMNPPFGSGGKMAMDHLAKAMRHTKPGGRVVALIPTGPAADKQFQKMMTADDFPILEWNFTADINLPPVTFEKAGTKVSSHVVIFDRVMKPDAMTETQRINMTGAQDIKEFFDRLEHIEVPARPVVDVKAPMPEQTVAPAPVETDGYETFDFFHTKTGKNKFGVQITENLGDRFKEVASIARGHDGYYSRYQNKAEGIRRGFLFNSDADRKAFIEDFQKPQIGLEEDATSIVETTNFKSWFGDSKVVDQDGSPLVVYHGAPDVRGILLEGFKPSISRGSVYFTSDSRSVANTYADDRRSMDYENAEPQVIPLYVSLQNPMVIDAKGGKWRETEHHVNEAKKKGHDGLIIKNSRDEYNNIGNGGKQSTVYAVFEATQMKSAMTSTLQSRIDGVDIGGGPNSGAFDPEDASILNREGSPAEEALQAILPALRVELDRLNLKRVKLSKDTDGSRQGAFIADANRLKILIGPSLDPMAVLHHEAIHALKLLDLFTPQEWRALEIKAARSWVDRYDIVARYPDLMPSEQIEEAIAEAFADARNTKKAPSGSILIRAFNKIVRMFKAIGNALRGAGFQTIEDVFGRAMSGEIGGRPVSSNSGFAAAMREARFPRRQTAQQKAHNATAMGVNGGAIHIPDRRIWEELNAANATYWQRLKGGADAANDWVDKARVFIQDRFLPVLRAQEQIIKQTGRPLPEQYNAYMAEETFSGKVGRHLFEIDEDFTKPIIDIMAGGKGEEMLDTEFVGTWLYARHAQERNAQIASINPNMPDGGSGMSNADAAHILADAAIGPHANRLLQIGDLLDTLRDRTLQLRLDAGLITQDEADVWRNQYQHYVPLKGFTETDHSEAMLDVTGIGRRFNTRGAESKRALGRGSEAFNPLQGAITQAQEVAIRAEKNQVGKALYKLAKDFPSKRLWSVKTPKQKRFYNRTTGLVETRVEDPVSLFLEPNEMAVKVDGQERRIVFHDIRLAESAGTVGADRMNWFISMMSKASRWFSSVNTMLDPEFVIRNAFRDMTAAQINIRNFGKDDRNAIAKSMVKNWPKAWVAAYRGQLNKDDSEWTGYYKEFEKSGAKVSFWKLEQPEAERGDLERRVKMSGGNLAQRASRFAKISTRDNPVLGFIERTNLAVDNAIRLAAYVEARKRGWSKPEAASLSKNLTVNFNRRGEWGASINALYPFANAGIQGTQILFRAMTSKRMAKYALGMVALGAILDQVNASLSEEDDDGELAYDKIPDWKNQMNLVVMLGPDSDSAAALWLPYGYNLFPYMGQQMSKVLRGVKGPDDAMADFASAMFGSFSPLGGRDIQSVVTPTMLDPINEMAMNEDWLGRPIRPESPYSDYGPNAYKYFGGVSSVSRELADVANRATGGTIAEPGAVDVSPEYLDHAFGFVTGGAGRFWGRTTDTIGKLVRGEFDDIEARNIPFYRSIKTDTGDWLDRNRYYGFRQEVREARDAMKTYQEASQPVPAHIRRLASLYKANQAAEKKLKSLRRAKKGVMARDDLSPAEASRRRKVIDDASASLYLQFNRAYVRVNGPQGE